jgi:hypothetical protein
VSGVPVSRAPSARRLPTRETSHAPPAQGTAEPRTQRSRRPQPKG